LSAITKRKFFHQPELDDSKDNLIVEEHKVAIKHTNIIVVITITTTYSSPSSPLSSSSQGVTEMARCQAPLDREGC